MATAEVALGALSVEDVSVHVLHGPIDSTGSFIGSPTVVPMQPASGTTFTGTYAVSAAGPYGLTVRAVPTHPGLLSPVELGLAAWAHE